MSSETEDRVCTLCGKKPEEPCYFEGKSHVMTFFNMKNILTCALASVPTVAQKPDLMKNSGMFIFEREVKDVVLCSPACSITFTAYQMHLLSVFKVLNGNDMYMNEKHKADVEGHIGDRLSTVLELCKQTCVSPCDCASE